MQARDMPHSVPARAARRTQRIGGQALKVPTGALLAAVLIFGAQGCTQQSQPEGTPNASPPAATVAATPAPTTAAVATQQTGATNMEPSISNVEVWQDHMPRIGGGPRPVHALLVVQVSSTLRPVGAESAGKITWKRPTGEEIGTADLRLNQQVDDLGMGQPGQKELEYVMAPLTASLQLRENETLQGTARLRFNTGEVEVNIPEATLTFTC